MKKVSILLLLTVVLASFTFAIEGVGDFTAGLEVDFVDVGGAKSDLEIDLFPSISFARSFGAFSLSAALGDGVGIPTTDGAKITDDLTFNVTPSYSVAAGPGELGFGLGIQLYFPITKPGAPSGDAYGLDNVLYFTIDPSISYGLDAGFGALSFDLATENIKIAKNQGDKPLEPEYGLNDIGAYFKAGLELPVGFGVWLKPVLNIAVEKNSKTQLTNFDFDLHYAITDAISAGVTTSIPTVKDGIKASGVTVKPHGEFSFGAVDAGVTIKLAGIASEAGDIVITPILTVGYNF
jgi:hypothetical protein